MATSRPSTVTALGIVEFILGVFAFVGGPVHLLLGVGGLVTYNGSDANLGNFATALGYIFTVESLVLFVTVYAIFSRRKWGWALSLAISLVGILTSLAVLSLYGSVGAIPGILTNLFAVYLLMLTAVKVSLRRGTPSST